MRLRVYSCIHIQSVAEIFWRFASSSPYGWFSYHLGLRLPQEGGSLDIRRIDETSSLISSTVPPWLCNADGRVCLAGAMALVDEVSTYGAIVPWDKQW